MLDTCPVSLKNGLCLLNCLYARCFSPRNRVAENPAMVFGEFAQPRIKTVKQVCLTCEFFLSQASEKEGSSPDDQ